VDVLTLTATPIPRTLHMALLGLRDISNLETPPEDRLAVEPRVSRFDPALIHHAILRELSRYSGRQPLIIVPADCSSLVRTLYGWGARNCELHVSQVRGEAAPSRGVIMPTYLPESA
jgi:hypothetical protein